MPDKILVVDDEVEIADLIEVYLNNENYSVFKFYSAKEALECINTTNLDLATGYRWIYAMPENQNKTHISNYYADSQRRRNG